MNPKKRPLNSEEGPAKKNPRTGKVNLDVVFKLTDWRCTELNDPEKYKLVSKEMKEFIPSAHLYVLEYNHLIHIC